MLSFAPLSLLGKYVSDLRLPFVSVSDVERRVYRAYGLTEGSFFQVYSLRVLWGYVKMVFSGQKLRKPVGTTAQLGGDFLIDEEGTVRFAHQSKSADDRPPVDELVRMVQKLP